MALNKIMLQGRLVATPELNEVGSDNVHVASMRIAVDHDRTNKDGVREADFFTVKAWRSTADFLCKYFDKGDPIIVDGRLTSRNWQDAEGNNRVALEIVADNLYFCGGKRDSDSGNNSAETRTATRRQQAAPSVEDDSELPF